jgi:FtsP/CotA-like multicopper oxidase with cupredoxin domain
MRWSVFFVLVTTMACSTSHDEGHAPGATPGDSPTNAAERERRPLAEIWGAPTLADENPDPNLVEVKLEAKTARATLVDREIDVLTYNGMVPGPVLQARPGQKVIVHFKNSLAEPTTVHWHGLRIPDEMDGSPRVQSPVAPGGTFDYQFVVPEAGSFWYHPHVDTHDQLERGLYGTIVVQGDLDPLYDVERYLVLDDVLLDEAGNISPPRVDGFSAMAGRWGNAFLTNGKDANLAKATAKRGQVERWRLVNTANARKMPIYVEGARVRMIATDGGLLEKPVEVTGDLVLPVGGRVDLEVSYEAAGAAKLVMRNGEKLQPMFSVDVADGPDAPRVVEWPAVKPAVPERAPTVAFDMSFDYLMEGAGGEWRINGESHSMEPMMTLPKGSTVRMRLSNASGGVAHPFHLHGQFFRIVEPAQPGLYDTVMVPEHGPVEIVAYFDNPGRWMAHCHILEHAEVGMMSEIVVTGSGTVAPPPTSSTHGH